MALTLQQAQDLRQNRPVVYTHNGQNYTINPQPGYISCLDAQGRPNNAICQLVVNDLNRIPGVNFQNPLPGAGQANGNYQGLQPVAPPPPQQPPQVVPPVQPPQVIPPLQQQQQQAAYQAAQRQAGNNIHQAAVQGQQQPLPNNGQPPVQPNQGQGPQFFQPAPIVQQNPVQQQNPAQGPIQPNQAQGRPQPNPAQAAVQPNPAQQQRNPAQQNQAANPVQAAPQAQMPQGQAQANQPANQQPGSIDLTKPENLAPVKRLVTSKQGWQIKEDTEQKMVVTTKADNSQKVVINKATGEVDASEGAIEAMAEMLAQIPGTSGMNISHKSNNVNILKDLAEALLSKGKLFLAVPHPGASLPQFDHKAVFDLLSPEMKAKYNQLVTANQNSAAQANNGQPIQRQAEAAPPAPRPRGV